jgi:hypothetical protein
MSDNSTFDFAILGGGSAGYAAARTAASLGLNTVVIDGAQELGGLCILRGCMPSKTLIESANRNLVIRESASFGLSAQAGPVNTLNIRDRKRRLITEFASYRQGQLEDGRFTLIRGFGKFEEVSEDVATLSVELLNGGSQQISARSVLIATGSEVSVPNITGLAETGFWTSDTLLDAAEIPDSFLVPFSLRAWFQARSQFHSLLGLERPCAERSPQHPPRDRNERVRSGYGSRKHGLHGFWQPDFHRGTGRSAIAMPPPECSMWNGHAK